MGSGGGLVIRPARKSNSEVAGEKMKTLIQTMQAPTFTAPHPQQLAQLPDDVNAFVMLLLL